MTDEKESAAIDPDNLSGADIDEQALMKIAVHLTAGIWPPEEDWEMVGPDYTPAVKESRQTLGVFIELLDALKGYLAARVAGPGPTIGVVRESLSRFDDALDALQAAWTATDERARHWLYLETGVPQPDDAENILVRQPEFPQWDRGAYRLLGLMEAVRRASEATKAVRREAEATAQDQRAPTPGLDKMVGALAAIFTRCTRSPVTRSKNRDGALRFIELVCATLPKGIAADVSIESAVRRLVDAATRGLPVA